LSGTWLRCQSSEPPSGMSKRKGSRNEHRSIALLEASGYHCTRSAGSLGTWDIVGIGSTDAVLVQCKTNRWPSPAEMEIMRLFPVPVNCRKLVHRWDDRKPMPSVKEL
jgi:hypothetical protein